MKRKRQSISKFDIAVIHNMHKENIEMDIICRVFEQTPKKIKELLKCDVDPNVMIDFRRRAERFYQGYLQLEKLMNSKTVQIASLDLILGPLETDTVQIASPPKTVKTASPPKKKNSPYNLRSRDSRLGKEAKKKK